MRHVVLVAILCLFAFPAAHAQDAPPSKSAAIAPANRVQIIEDDESGEIRFVIDGKEVGWFDATGFYVRGDIAYEGTIADGLPAQEAPDAP
jgi:hypothetical protein